MSLSIPDESMVVLINGEEEEALRAKEYVIDSQMLEDSDSDAEPEVGIWKLRLFNFLPSHARVFTFQEIEWSTHERS